MIQLVIEITEEDYNNIEPFLNGETIKGGFNLFKALEIIKNGKPLSKGHGRLFNERDIVNGNYEIIGNKIYEVDPIIEADKEEGATDNAK